MSAVAIAEIIIGCIALVIVIMAIDLIHKWRLINYFFVFMLISLTSLVCTNKIQKNFCFKVRLVRIINIKTNE